MDVVEALEAMVSGYIDRVTGAVSNEIDSDGYAAYYILQEAIKEINHLRMNFRQMAVDLKNHFEEITHKSPNTIHVTKEMENNIYLLTPNEVGDETCAKIREHGPRHVFERILGMEVVWDANEFRVERVENVREDEVGDKEDDEGGENDGD